MQITPVLAITCLAACASGAINPFTEPFDAGPENWRDNSLINDVDWTPAGGLDGSAFVSASTNVDSAAFGLALSHRGQASFGSSNGAFVGNWIADGVAAIEFDFRHDAPVPLGAGARFASPFNFPGAAALSFVPAPSGVWTRVTIPVAPANVFLEGTDYNSVFSNIGNVQLGIVVPESLAGTGTLVTVDIDNVTIVPTPGVAAPLAMGGLLLAGRRRR